MFDWIDSIHEIEKKKKTNQERQSEWMLFMACLKQTKTQTWKRIVRSAWIFCELWYQTVYLFVHYLKSTVIHRSRCQLILLNCNSIQTPEHYYRSAPLWDNVKVLRFANKMAKFVFYALLTQSAFQIFTASLLNIRSHNST